MSEARRYYLITPLTYTGAATAFTYHADTTLDLGQVVQIPIGRRSSLGIVTGSVPKPDFATKSTTAALDLPPIPPYLRDLADWMSAYYATSPSSVWSTMLPTGLTKARRTTPPTKSHIAQGLPSFNLTPDPKRTSFPPRRTSRSMVARPGAGRRGR